MSASRTVLYDDDCGFCKWSLDKIMIWDRRRRELRPIPIQGAEGRQLLAAGGVPEADQLESWHVVLPSGEVHSAGAAAPYLFETLPGGRPLAGLFRLFPRITDRAYRLIAGNRDRISRLLGIDATCQVRRS
jgi:predicted DCC family thiol-disulfide oxidoreductase YuxK